MWSSLIRVPVLASRSRWQHRLGDLPYCVLRKYPLEVHLTRHLVARGTGGSARRVKAQPPDRPDPRHALPGPRPGLLRAPARHPPPDRPPTPASSAPSASKSPSSASAKPDPTEQARPRPPGPYRPADPDRLPMAGSAHTPSKSPFFGSEGRASTPAGQYRSGFDLRAECARKLAASGTLTQVTTLWTEVRKTVGRPHVGSDQTSAASAGPGEAARSRPPWPRQRRLKALHALPRADTAHLGMTGTILLRERSAQKPDQCRRARTTGSECPQPAGQSSSAAYRTAAR